MIRKVLFHIRKIILKTKKYGHHYFLANVVKSVLFSNLRTFKDVQFGVSAFVTEEKNVVPGFPSDFKVQEYYINRALYFKADFNFIEIYQINQIYDLS